MREADAHRARAFTRGRRPSSSSSISRRPRPEHHRPSIVCGWSPLGQRRYSAGNYRRPEASTSQPGARAFRSTLQPDRRADVPRSQHAPIDERKHGDRPSSPSVSPALLRGRESISYANHSQRRPESRRMATRRATRRVSARSIVLPTCRSSRTRTCAPTGPPPHDRREDPSV